LELSSEFADLSAALDATLREPAFPAVIRWNLLDRRRVTPVPCGHWLLVEDTVPFRVSLEFKDEQGNSRGACHASAIAVREGYVAYFPPRENSTDATLTLERYGGSSPEVSGAIRFLAANPGALLPSTPRGSDVVLLTNGRGGMARLCVDLGRVKS